MAVGYSIVLWFILASWLRRRLAAGELLLDLGRDRSSLALVLLGSSLLVVVLLAAAGAGPGPDLATTVGGTSCAAYCIVTGSTRTQMRANGIVGGVPLFPHFLEWRRIESYEIAGSVLGLTVRRRWPLLGAYGRHRLNLRLPPAHARAAEDVLRGRVQV